MKIKKYWLTPLPNTTLIPSTYTFTCSTAMLPFGSLGGLWEFLGGNSVTFSYNVLFSVNSQTHLHYCYPWKRLLIIPQHPFSLIIWSRIFLLSGFSKAHHRSGRDYIFQPLLHPDMTIRLSSSQGYLRGSNVCNLWIMPLKRKLFSFMFFFSLSVDCKMIMMKWLT